jgi:hypothetical protein
MSTLDLKKAPRFPHLANLTPFLAVFLFSVFLLHPGRFSVMEYKTFSEDDILDSVFKYTGKQLK